MSCCDPKEHISNNCKTDIWISALRGPNNSHLPNHHFATPLQYSTTHSPPTCDALARRAAAAAAAAEVGGAVTTGAVCCARLGGGGGQRGWWWVVVVMVMLWLLLQALPPCARIAVDADYGQYSPLATGRKPYNDSTRAYKNACNLKNSVQSPCKRFIVPRLSPLRSSAPPPGACPAISYRRASTCPAPSTSSAWCALLCPSNHIYLRNALQAAA